MPFSIDDLNYEKDSKERMPWEHYLELYAKADPKEITSRLSIPYDEEAKEFTLTFLGSEYKITYPDFQVKHVADEKKCYPLEDMIYAKICRGVKYTFDSLTDAVSKGLHLPMETGWTISGL